MVRAGCSGVDSGGIHTGMSQDICEVKDILMLLIISARKQVAEIVRKHLARIYPASFLSFFIMLQILLRSNGFLCLEQNTGPALISFCLQYFIRRFRNSLVR